MGTQNYLKQGGLGKSLDPNVYAGLPREKSLCCRQQWRELVAITKWKNELLERNSGKIFFFTVVIFHRF
jgi:hypothetical protein